MPGLSQLKQFNKDILSLGDEIQLRAQRGEKPVRVSIPKSIQDIDDSEEFVMGMPEKEAVAQTTSVDDDLSELQNLTATKTTQSDKKEDTAEPSFEAPDLSALLAPMEEDSGALSGAADMPDLSMFMEPEEQPEPEEQIIEEKETSIADLSLEDLLGGAGFDGSSNPAVEPPSSSEIDEEDEEFYSGGFGDDSYTPKKKPAKAPVITNDLNFYDEPEETSDSDTDVSFPDKGQALSLEELGLGDLDNSNSTTSAQPENFDISNDDNFSDIEELEELGDDNESLNIEETQSSSSDFDFNIPQEPKAEQEDFSSFDFSLSSDISENELSESEEISSLNSDALELAGDNVSQGTGMDFSNSPELNEGFGSDFEKASGLDSLDLPDFDTPQNPDTTVDTDFSFDSSAETSEISSQEEDFSSLELPSMDGSDFNIPETTEDFSQTVEENPFDIPDNATGDLPPQDEESSPVIDFSSFSFDTPSENTEGTSESDTTLDSFDSENSFESDEFNTESPFGTDATEDISDSTESFSTDFNIDEDESGTEIQNSDEDLPIETFDISEMEGMEFNVPDTDSQLESSSHEDSESSFDAENFEIPGFSDVQTAKEEKYTPVFAKAGSDDKKKGEELPPNTLSDEQYKVFLKNLSEYPLNVRLAFEDLIVKNEFTDDAEFEIIEKILHKAPARQVATMLEKMLDISIPVPRDFEHRTAEEYEAYKKSIQYQLKNKIVPAVFAGMIILVVSFGLFEFGKNCIYIPAKASSLYRQGYNMLLADEYPQSKEKFYAATEYQKKKKWYFKYARGYRDRKQYITAEEIYKKILSDFKHDKEAGIEYARMNLDDLANYERAEEICRREVLDYHVNDEEGILLLGDIFLEWGTEKEPAKLEDAKEQYNNLLQLYKNQNLYLSRLMRYYIRTDNLPEVIPLKERFLPKEKNLCAEDWTELSGYLLDKLYGPLPPSREYLREYIEDVKLLLARAVKMDPSSPVAYYNLSRYYIETNEALSAKESLIKTIDNFNNSKIIRRRDMYKFIDAYRLSGEEYSKAKEYMRAQEFYTQGITLFTQERDNSGLPGTVKVGILFADQADIDYFISGDYDNALQNYIYSVKLENDSSSIRYKIGYIQYKNSNYTEAFGSFMKAGDGTNKEPNLLLAMGNTLAIRGDNYPAQGYYEKLVDKLEEKIAEKGTDLVQGAKGFEELITLYLYATNNYGVTLNRLAQRTGSSAYNAESIVQLSQSLRAWDALTRNKETMTRLGGSNLPQENIRYITHPVPDFQPSIFIEIPKTISDSETF